MQFYEISNLIYEVIKKQAKKCSTYVDAQALCWGESLSFRAEVRGGCVILFVTARFDIDRDACREEKKFLLIEGMEVQEVLDIVESILSKNKGGWLMVEPDAVSISWEDKYVLRDRARFAKFRMVDLLYGRIFNYAPVKSPWDDDVTIRLVNTYIA